MKKKAVKSIEAIILMLMSALESLSPVEAVYTCREIGKAVKRIEDGGKDVIKADLPRFAVYKGHDGATYMAKLTIQEYTALEIPEDVKPQYSIKRTREILNVVKSA